MKNDLATPELGIVDLDSTTDFDNAPVCTGPFVIETFVPEGDVTVAKNTCCDQSADRSLLSSA